MTWPSPLRATPPHYSSPEGELICDYRYGLQEAITDGVCRSPRIVLLDNLKVQLTAALETESAVKFFPSIAALLGESPITYEDLLRHNDVIHQILGLGCERLDEIRRFKLDAAGVVVATDIQHAYQVALVLEAREEAYHVVTNKTSGAQQVINLFRHSDCR